jgi:hypothetical protein
MPADFAFGRKAVVEELCRPLAFCLTKGDSPVLLTGRGRRIPASLARGRSCSAGDERAAQNTDISVSSIRHTTGEPSSWKISTSSRRSSYRRQDPLKVDIQHNLLSSDRHNACGYRRTCQYLPPMRVSVDDLPTPIPLHHCHSLESQWLVIRWKPSEISKVL